MFEPLPLIVAVLGMQAARLGDTRRDRRDSHRRRHHRPPRLRLHPPSAPARRLLVQGGQACDLCAVSPPAPLSLSRLFAVSRTLERVSMLRHPLCPLLSPPSSAACHRIGIPIPRVDSRLSLPVFRCCARADSEAGDQADTAEPGHAPAAPASEQNNSQTDLREEKACVRRMILGPALAGLGAVEARSDEADAVRL